MCNLSYIYIYTFVFYNATFSINYLFSFFPTLYIIPIYTVQLRINNRIIARETDYDRVQFIPIGVYTIVEVKSGKGASAWGRLKSGIGWISLDCVKRV